MIQRYDGKQALKMRMALVADDVYCIVSDALKKLYPEKTPLNNVEIWMAAQGFTCSLIGSAEPEEIFSDLVEVLKDEGGEFRDEGFSVFLILMVSMCQISGLRERIANAKPLVERLIAVCRQNEMFFSLLEQFDGKEMSRRAVGKKIDLLNYEMKAVGDNQTERRQMLDAFVEAVLKLGPQNIESNLLVLNKLNLENGHIWDEQILSLYEQLEKKSAIQKGIELILGNKNVAEGSSVQLNGEIPKDVAGVLGMLNDLKLLGNGK